MNQEQATPVAHLTLAGEHLARGDETSALLALLQAWQAKRSPEIAAAVQALSSRFERLRAAPQDKTQRGRLVKWVEIARRMDPTDMAMLLATFEAELQLGHADLVVPRLDELERRADDPRVVSHLLRALEQPQIHGTRSRKMFTRIFKCLLAAGDPACIERLRAAVQSTGGRPNPPYDAWIVRDRGPKIVAELEARFPDGAPELEPSEAEAVARLTATISSLPEPSLDAAPAATPRREEAEAELLAAVYRDPDDDGPRLVYADWLEQQGDSRGELIVLQIARAQGTTSPKALRREKALMKEHFKALLGPLTTVVSKASAVFERGFLAQCSAVIKKPAQAETELKHDAWGTVHTLRLSGPTRITPAMRALREVDGVCDFGLRGLVEAPRPGLRGLGMVLRDDALMLGEARSPGLRALVGATGLPNLVRLSMSNLVREYVAGQGVRYRGPRDWRWVFDAPFSASLESFGVDQHLEQDGIVADWLAELAARAPKIRRLELRGNYDRERIVLERDAEGDRWSAVIRVDYDVGMYVSSYFQRMRGALVGAPLSRVVLDSPARLTDPQIQSVMEAGAPLRKAGADVSVVVTSLGD